MCFWYTAVWAAGQLSFCEFFFPGIKRIVEKLKIKILISSSTVGDFLHTPQRPIFCYFSLKQQLWLSGRIRFGREGMSVKGFEIRFCISLLKRAEKKMGMEGSLMVVVFCLRLFFFSLSHEKCIFEVILTKTLVMGNWINFGLRFCAEIQFYRRWVQNFCRSNSTYDLMITQKHI